MKRRDPSYHIVENMETHERMNLACTDVSVQSEYNSDRGNNSVSTHNRKFFLMFKNTWTLAKVEFYDKTSIHPIRHDGPDYMMLRIYDSRKYNLIKLKYRYNIEYKLIETNLEVITITQKIKDRHEKKTQV